MTGARPTEARRGPLPPVYFVSSAVLQWVADASWPLSRLIPSPWNRLGVVPTALGLGVMIAAARRFSAVSTEIRPFARRRPSLRAAQSTLAVARSASVDSNDPRVALDDTTDHGGHGRLAV